MLDRWHNPRGWALLALPTLAALSPWWNGFGAVDNLDTLRALYMASLDLSAFAASAFLALCLVLVLAWFALRLARG